jgi:hypothetical protein
MRERGEIREIGIFCAIASKAGSLYEHSIFSIGRSELMSERAENHRKQRKE